MQLKSDQSTTFQILADTKYINCIRKLKEQNQYLKQALQTAQSLIKNYQQENNRLEIQIKILDCKIKKYQNNKEYQIIVEKSRIQKDVKRSNFGNEKNWNNQNKGHYNEELNNKIKKLMATQEKYQDKISELEHKIVILEHSSQAKKLNKQHYALNIQQKRNYQKSETQYSLKFNEVSQKKNKNLHQLRIFHMKLKNQQGISDRNSQKNMTGKGLVQRVFSKEKIQEDQRKSSKKKDIKRKKQN